MTIPDTLVTLADLADDLAASRQAEARIEAFFAQSCPEPILTRGGPPRPAVQKLLSGQQLLRHCPDDTQKRYRTLLHFEQGMLSDGDHGALMAPACQILEDELRRELMSPAQAELGDELLAPLTRDQSEVLVEWYSGKTNATMGVICAAFFALRRGCEKRHPAILDFLSRRFLPRFRELLRGGLENCLHALRRHYRNPAFHGERTFDETDYTDFSRLMVASDRFSTWHHFGPSPSEPPAQVGILHHHLANTRLAKA